MNITRGPMIERFARITDIDVKEVLEWANNYVNHPELFEQTEETTNERASSLNDYITFRCENGINARIMASIVAQKNAISANSGGNHV